MTEQLAFSTTCEPVTAFSMEEQQCLAGEVMEIVRRTSGREAIEDDEVVPYLMGIPGRGKILTIVRGDHGEILGFTAGQVLNDGRKELLFNGEPVLHISTAHVVPGQRGNVGFMAMEELLRHANPRPSLISAFTQNPRVYEYACRLSRGNIYPSMDSNERLKKIHDQLVEILVPEKGVEVENGVFKGKMEGSFYGDIQFAKKKETNDWFFNVLGVKPAQGDLLLVLLRWTENVRIR